MAGELPKEHGLRPCVQVTVALSTLLGVDEQPGELAGSGPIPAAVARRIAADPTGTWRRLVTDQTGRLLDYGRNTYRPPKDLAEHVIARDRTCRFPNCNRQARHCDLEHATPWHDGGHTNDTNLNAICPRHHRAKHDAGWQPQQQPDGIPHLDQPHRPPLRRRTRHLPHRPHDPTRCTHRHARTTRAAGTTRACPNQPRRPRRPRRPQQIQTHPRPERHQRGPTQPEPDASEDRNQTDQGEAATHKKASRGAKPGHKQAGRCARRDQA